MSDIDDYERSLHRAADVHTNNANAQTRRALRVAAVLFAAELADEAGEMQAAAALTRLLQREIEATP